MLALVEGLKEDEEVIGIEIGVMAKDPRRCARAIQRRDVPAAVARSAKRATLFDRLVDVRQCRVEEPSFE